MRQQNRRVARYACVSIAAVCFATACRVQEQPKIAVSLVDQQLQLEKGEVKSVPFELPADKELKLDVAHLSGDPVSIFFLEKSDLNEFHNSRALRFYTKLSHPKVDNLFDSGWQQLKSPAIYAVLLEQRTASKSDSSKVPAPSVVNLRVLSR